MAPTALITGGSEGIGRATALLLAQQGYDLVLAARTEENLVAVAAEIQTLGRDVLTVPTDVSQPQQVQELVQKALAHYGTIDVLVNNAGIYASGSTESFTLADWHQVLDTNLWGYIHTIQALLPHFLERGQGTIVNLSSIGGKVPIPYLTPYCTSKFAITGLTECLHAELKPRGIHVAAIFPSLIKSSLMERAIFRGNQPEDAQGRREQLDQVLQVPGIEKPEDVAKAVWEAIKHQRSQVVVGSANLSQTLYSLFPGLMQWVFRRTFARSEL